MALKMKTGGRQKGTPNRTTKNIKEAINLIVSNNIDRLQDDIDSLEPKERIKVIIDFLPFVVPKLQSVQTDAEPEAKEPVTIRFENYDNNH